MPRRSLPIRLLAILIAGWLAAGTGQSEAAQSAPDGTTPTEVSADLGGCSALITVTGADSKPVYNAKVSTHIRYGLFGAKKLDLEVYTSASGQVKIVGLPEAPKKPVFFQVSKGDQIESVEFKPESQCSATFDVRLK